jgi:hypothetical protein
MFSPIQTCLVSYDSDSAKGNEFLALAFHAQVVTHALEHERLSVFDVVLLLEESLLLAGLTFDLLLE